MTGLALLLGVVGALCGGVAAAVVTGRYARQTTEQRELAGRREEWGRRFTLAIELMARSDEAAQALGISLFRALRISDLAGPGERQLMQTLVPTVARQPVGSETETRRRHLYLVDDREDDE